jgi:uncharacterized protein
MSAAQLLVLAKAPVPGNVKTRLCPPYRPAEAAQLAAAALADTLDATRRTPLEWRVLVLDGTLPVRPPGFELIRQRTGTLGMRIADALIGTARPGVASILVGMDTLQLTPQLLTGIVRRLHAPGVDAILGPSADGGWWCLGRRDPQDAVVLASIPTSTPRTGETTRAALEHRVGRVAIAPVLRDVDTAAM